MDIVTAYAAGKSSHQIAALCGRPQWAVRQELLRAGVTLRPKHDRRLERSLGITPADLRRVYEDEKLSVSALCQRFGMCRETATSWLTAAGAKTRRWGSARSLAEFRMVQLRLPTASVDIAYLAGLVDGEGCFSAADGRPFFALGLTAMDLVEALHTRIGGTLSYRMPQHGRWKKQAMWRIARSADVLVFCKALVPYLRIKHRQAAILGIIAEAMLSGVKADTALYSELRALNRRGTAARRRHELG